MLSSASVLGYDAPVSIPMDEFEDPVVGSEIIISTEPLLETPEVMDFSVSDTIFIDNLGNVFYGTSEAKTSCIHTFTTGQVQYHTKKLDGGCDTIQSEAVFCTQCQLIRSQEYISTASYKVCPHK